MGVKGDSMKKESELATELLLEKLAGIEHVTSKKMFGGHGIFHDGKMFGIVDSKGKCFLKANATNLALFEKYNSQKHSKMPYYHIPSEVWNDLDTLLEMAHSSIEIGK